MNRIATKNLLISCMPDPPENASKQRCLMGRTNSRMQIGDESNPNIINPEFLATTKTERGCMQSRKQWRAFSSISFIALNKMVLQTTKHRQGNGTNLLNNIIQAKPLQHTYSKPHY